jgi:trehalose 6-phosphate synthase
VNLVVVSNRVARAKANEPMTGGLAAALLPVVESSGAIWVGSSGRLTPRAYGPVNMEIQALGAGALALLDMPASDYTSFYEGFANSALWPALHSRSDLIRVCDDDYRAYRRINSFMAQALLRFRKSNTAFWIQDYHFLALGEELRRLGVIEPIGFFLHTPWPAASVAVSVPHHRELCEAMLAYDVIGFQTEDDCQHFADYLRDELSLTVEDGLVRSRHGLSRLAVFPIGIDVDGFAAQAAKATTHPEVSRLRLSLRGEKLAIGVDRVDYSKGLVNRINAFDRLLTNSPSLKRAVSLLQIATPSRDAIDAYSRLQGDLATLVTNINGKHGEADWTPIRYLNKGYGHQVLSGFYRSAQVGVVTPLHDGMNLVAKEYVAAQNPDDPGVLVLSKFAGAANELDTALLVNPNDIDAVARALSCALSMSILERRERWHAMMAKLRAHTIHQWFADFLSALDETPLRTAPPAPGSATVLQLAATGSGPRQMH